jgi:hypothetical protein
MTNEIGILMFAQYEVQMCGCMLQCDEMCADALPCVFWGLNDTQRLANHGRVHRNVSRKSPVLFTRFFTLHFRYIHT